MRKENDMKIALIGHSGSGKTTTAKSVSKSPSESDMDRILDPKKEPSAEELLSCILDAKSEVIAVSVHKSPSERNCWPKGHVEISDSFCVPLRSKR
jgi:ABC-type glutathione transport system ATPase component